MAQGTCWDEWWGCVLMRRWRGRVATKAFCEKCTPCWLKNEGYTFKLFVGNPMKAIKNHIHPILLHLPSILISQEQ
jgi:hypothetical protein